MNAAFAKDWKAKTGETRDDPAVARRLGQAGARVIDGLEADVVTLALAYDIDAIAVNGQHAAGTGRRSLPHNSSPYTSTHRVPGAQGQPEGDQGLGRPGQARRLRSITPNPKTSGGARWNYLAAWGYARSAGRLTRRRS